MRTAISGALVAVLALAACGTDAVDGSSYSTSGGVGMASRGAPPEPEDAGVAQPVDAGGVDSNSQICLDGGVCAAGGVCCGDTCCSFGQYCCNGQCLQPTVTRPACGFEFPPLP